MALHRFLDDGEPLECPDVARLWPIAVVAREFGVLPSVAAESMDNDPARLDTVCTELLHYADAKAAYERAKDRKQRDQLVRSSRLAEMVEEHVFALAKEKHGDR